MTLSRNRPTHGLVLILGLSLLLTALTSTAAYEDLFADLIETQSIGESTILGIDPNALLLSEDALVTVYFVGEGAGYKNSFGWYDASTDPTDWNNRNMIWSNASGTGPGLAGGGSLDQGDSVSLGTLTAGTRIGFFLVANGHYDPYGYTYYTDSSYNVDGIEHVIAGVTGEDGLLAIGFEDLYGGGDEDYNDLMIAIDIGVQNVETIVAAAPEPEIWLMMLLGGLFMWFRKTFE